MTVKGYESDLADVDRGGFLTSRRFVLSDMISAYRWRIAKSPQPPKTGGHLPPDPRGYFKKGYEGHRQSSACTCTVRTIQTESGVVGLTFGHKYWLGR